MTKEECAIVTAYTEFSMLRGAWVGIYNFDSVFCVELKPV